MLGYSAGVADDRHSIAWFPSGGSASAQLLAWVGERTWVLVEGDESDPDAPLPVFMNLSRDSRGRVVCTGLIVGRLPPWDDGRVEVTSRNLRTIRISELIGLVTWDDGAPDEWSTAVRALMADAPVLKDAPRRPGPKGHPDDHFRAIAHAYRRAQLEAPRAPMRWLVEHLDRSEPTVRRWVQRARDKGYLGAAVPGRAGEAHDDEGETR